MKLRSNLLVRRAKDWVDRRRPRNCEIVKEGSGAADLAASLRQVEPLTREARRAVEAISKRMLAMNDPRPDKRYGTVARHFASASSTTRKLSLWQQIVRIRRPGTILEIGSAYGLSAVAMHLTEDRPRVVTIEFFEPQATLGASNIRLSGAVGVECIQMDKVDALPMLAAEGRKFDLVFHDGGHAGDAYVADFKAIVPMLECGSVYIVDDIAWDDRQEVRELTRDSSSRTCREGWLEIVGDSRVGGAIAVDASVGILLIE